MEREKDELQELAVKIAILKNPHFHHLDGIKSEDIEKELAKVTNRMEKLLYEREGTTKTNKGVEQA